MFDLDPHQMVKASPKRSMWTPFSFFRTVHQTFDIIHRLFEDA
jgi:hypothetical protein